MRDGKSTLAKTAVPLKFVWSFDEVDLAGLNPTTVVVSRDPDDRWYVTFAVTSDGADRVANPCHVARKARNPARHQRRLARCPVGSNNRRKAKIKFARAHRKVRNARQDFLHRTSAHLVRSADLIAIEDPAVRNMVRHRRSVKLFVRHWTCPDCRTRLHREVRRVSATRSQGAWDSHP